MIGPSPSADEPLQTPLFTGTGLKIVEQSGD